MKGENIMKKILSVALCACILVSAFCMTTFALSFGHGEPCWEGLVYGEFAEQGRRSVKSTGDEFTGRILVEFGDKVPFDKMISINDFPGLEIEKVENLVSLKNGSCYDAYITLKDKSYESVIAALEYLEDYKYVDFKTILHSLDRRDNLGGLHNLPDEERTDEENEALYAAAEEWNEKTDGNWHDAYEGVFDYVQAELKHGKNLVDMCDYRQSIGHGKWTYGYEIIAEINTDEGIVNTEYFNGDADGNTLLNVADAVRILKYEAKWDGVDVELGADADFNGVVNVKDCVEVLKMLVGNR